LDHLFPGRIISTPGSPSTLLTTVHSKASGRTKKYVIHMLHYVPRRLGGTNFDVVTDVIPLYDVQVEFNIPLPKDLEEEPSHSEPNGKGKGKEKDLRTDVLRQNTRGGATPKMKLALHNPFAPPKAGGRTPKWNGIVDLASTTTDSTATDLPPGISSPPVTMTFPTPRHKLTRTPAREAATLIAQQFLASTRGDTPDPPMPTPPSISRYIRYQDRSQVRGEHLRVEGRALDASPIRRTTHREDIYDMSDEDSYSDEHRDPVPAPLFAGANEEEDEGDSLDQSYGTESSDTDSGGEGEIEPHPLFASVEGSGSLAAGQQHEYDEEYSDEDDPDPTLFGRRATDPPHHPEARLRLMGDIVDTFHGGRLEDAALYESPTPWQGRR